MIKNETIAVRHIYKSNRLLISRTRVVKKNNLRLVVKNNKFSTELHIILLSFI